jgi:HTH-type transcriptional regulator, sugar sensing transcriptional regulator
MKESVIDHLTELGFSGAEAAVYVALLQEPKATGYRIARMAGKPVPNTYKALDALHKKGAIIVDETGRGRTYTALPVSEFFDGMKHRLDTMRVHLEEELKGLAMGSVEGGIYQLNTPDQVYGRARTLLREAKSVALVDIFPTPLEALRGDLEAAAKRGVHVWALTYLPGEIKGCEVIAPKKPALHLEIWKADWMNIIVDSREALYSLLKKDGTGVFRAVWIKDPYLALQAFSGAFHEFIFDRAGQLIWSGKSKEELAAEFRNLNRRYVTDDSFYEVQRAWVDMDKVREMRRRADREDAALRRKSAKEKK